MIFWKRSASLVITVLFLFGLSPTSAQTDPEGLRFSQQLFERFEAEDSDGFGDLVTSNPELTMRAFLASVEYALGMLMAGNEEEGTQGLLVATLAAKGLETVSGDTEPMKLMEAFQNEDPEGLNRFIEYAETNHPGYAEALQQFIPWFEGSEQGPESNYNTPRHSPDSLSADYLQQIRPYLVGLQRVALTTAFSAPNLLLQELERFPALEEDVASKIKAAGSASWARFQEDFFYVKPRLSIARLRILAETGLLGEFDSEVTALLTGNASDNDKLELLYAGFRMASRQQLWSTADRYLDQMAELMDHSMERTSPVFPFVVQTGRMQLRFAKGEEIESSELVASFNSAWDNFKDYKPMVSVEDDVTWHLLRGATHFWVDRLSELADAESTDPILRITLDCQAWVTGKSEFGRKVDTLTDEMTLFYNEQLQGYLTVSLANLDTLVYIIEKWKPVQADPVNFSEVANVFPESIAQIREAAVEISQGLSAMDSIPFELEKAALLTELEARCLYLLAIDPNNRTTEKIAKLKIAEAKFDTVTIPESYIDYHLLLGHRYLALQQGQAALNSWEKAHRLAIERNFVERAIESATLLTKEYGKIGDWDKAQALASEATSLIEQQIDGSKTRVGKELARLNESLVEVQAKAAIQADKPELALAAITRNHQIQSANVQLEANPEASAATQELNSKKQQMAVLNDKVRELQELPASSMRDQLIEKTQKLLAQTKSEFLLQSRSIRQRFSRLYTTALRFDPLNLPDVQQALPSGTAVVQYFPTDEELFIFVVTSDKFRLRSVAQRKDELDGLISTYIKDLRSPHRPIGPMTERSNRLYRVLIEPVESDLADSDTLVLIPSGQLNFLPFASLTSLGGKYLLEEKVLLELAKPTDFLKIATSKPEPPGRVVAFANATLDLPAAEQEGKSIAALFDDSRLFTRNEATKKNLMEFGAQADVLHFATHGVWDSTDSTNNHLELADGQSLAQEEIFDLGLERTSIVTLSACNTAMGDSIEGKYVASLAEAFWIAGSRTVVASLWQVDDTSTSVLMTEFYENLKDGKPKGESLRDAQLQVLGGKEFQHPYYWSGFSLFGDYR